MSTQLQIIPRNPIEWCNECFLLYEYTLAAQSCISVLLMLSYSSMSCFQVLLVFSGAVSAQLLPWGSLYERFQPVPVPSTELQPPPPPSEPEGDLQPPPIPFDDDAKSQLFTITEESSVEPSTEKPVSVEETGDEVVEVLKIVPKNKAYPKKYRPELHKQQEGEVKKNYSPKQQVLEQVPNQIL